MTSALKSAGDFIVSCMGKTRAELAAADSNLAKIAPRFGLTEADARFYLTNEMNRSDRRK